VGATLFAAFVVFVTPAELPLVISPYGGGDLAAFGVICAAVFGPPGYFAFPRRHRLRAVGWLALASLVYGVMMVLALLTVRFAPSPAASPETREFVAGLTIHYPVVAALAAGKLAVGVSLLRWGGKRAGGRARGEPVT
jgi:hypothetical protein